MTTKPTESEIKVYEIPLADIFCDNDFNCRGPIAPVDVIDLARSISEQGLQSPIVVQPWLHAPFKYRIVSGHRRYNAFRVNQTKTIPSIIKEGLTELGARQLNLEENLKRKDLNLLQESSALRPFMKAGWTEQDMASRFNQSRGWVQARVALLSLPEEIQQEAAAGFLSQEHVKQLKSIKSRDDQFEAVKKIKASKLAGERKKIRAAPKKQNPLAKRLRSREEIFTMMEMFMDVIGPDFYSRCMSWAAGEISDFELMRDFRDLARDKYGKDWSMPASVMRAVVS